MAGTIFEGFSVTHAAILDGTTGAEEVNGDIYGVRTGTIAADTGNYDNTGDDTVLSSWFWINFATLTIEAGYVPFQTIAMLQGSTVTSSGAGQNIHYSTDLWNEGALNTPPRPVLIRVPSKDEDGITRILDIILYKVQFGPINFTGPSYKSGLLLNYTGRALLASKDEKGQALSEKSIGRLVNKPG